MFKKLFGKRPEPLVTVPLLACESMPDPHLVSETAARIFPGCGVRVTETPSIPNSLGFETQGIGIVAIHMPHQIPGDEVDVGARVSAYWPRDRLPVAYRSHVILVAREGDTIAKVSALTRLAVGLLNSCDGAGWYVESGRLVHLVEFATEVATALHETDEFPVSLWVNCLVSDNESGGLNSSTIGLSSLGHRDFEVIGTRKHITELRENLFDLAAFVLNAGPVLKHGDTCGPSDEERWRIEIGRSKLGIEGKVIRIGIP